MRSLAQRALHRCRLRVAGPALAGALLAFAPGASAVSILSEDFEGMATSLGTSCFSAYTMANGWLNETGDDGDWLVDANGTGSLGTGPSGDHSHGGSGHYAYVEASGCASDVKNLASPVLDLTGLAGVAVSFAYHMFGPAMGELHFDVSSDGGASFVEDVAAPIVGDQGDAWHLGEVHLGAFDGESDLVFRFRAVIGPSFASDIALDSIEFSTGNAPPLPVPEPGTASLLGLALGGLGALRSRRAAHAPRI